MQKTPIARPSIAKQPNTRPSQSTGQQSNPNVPAQLLKAEHELQNCRGASGLLQVIKTDSQFLSHNLAVFIDEEDNNTLTPGPPLVKAQTGPELYQPTEHESEMPEPISADWNPNRPESPAIEDSSLAVRCTTTTLHTQSTMVFWPKTGLQNPWPYIKPSPKEES